MMMLETATVGHVAESVPFPAFGRSGLFSETDISPDLWGEVQALLPSADGDTISRVAEAVSLRGADLVGALLARLGDVDEALAALEDYAGAYEQLTDFAAEVHAERAPNAADLDLKSARAFADMLLARGDIITLRLGTDLHIFWRV